MRREIILIATLLICACSSKEPAIMEATLPADYYAGTLRMYPFKDVKRIKPPKGYKPFMISHYGRHGARFHGDDTQGEGVYAVLDSAAAAGRLTAAGDSLRNYIGLYYKLYAGHRADLTEKGRQQQRELGKRMRSAYPDIFRRGVRIEARSTPVPRCILSMGAFCDGLGLWAEQSASAAYSPVLAPQLSLPGFEEKSRAAWGIARKEALSWIDPSRFLKRIFGDENFKVLSYPSEVSFMRNVYFLLCNAPCLDVDLPEAPKVFTDSEWERLWEVTNLVYYTGGYADSAGVRASAALMDDILSLAREDIASGGRAVRLRFGHDSHLMSLLAYMGVPQWTGRTWKLEEVKTLWQDWRIPMAANLQLVFYRNSSSDILILPLLNEEPLELPMPAVSDVFYKWKDFEKQYE